MTRKPWPTRAEWQADAEPFTRTLVYPHQRVPERADHWLTTDEITEARALAHSIAKTLRRAITHTVNALAPQFPDEPGRPRDRFAWSETLDQARHAEYERLAESRSDRLHLGRCARLLDQPLVTVRRAAGAGRSIAVLAGKWGNDDTAAGIARLTDLLAAMTERCDTAAADATEQAVRAEVARRATDEAWIKELARRERINRMATNGRLVFD